MATSSNAMIKIETSSTVYEQAEMTDSGNHTIYKVTGIDEFSGDPDVEVYPNGISSGINLLYATGANDTVGWPAFTAYIGGAEVDVAAGTISITRPTSAVAKVCSIVTDATGTVDEEEGTDSLSTAFTETRNAAGGPPYIAVAEIEIGQVRVTSDSAAPIADSEIKQNPGQHAEFADFPNVKTISHVGDGDIAATSASKKTAYVEFASALPLTHTGGVTKKVFVTYATPNMTEIPRCMDYTPCESSSSVSSTQYYGGNDASVSTSLGQGGFTVRCDDGIKDFIVRRANKNTVVFFYPNRDKVAMQKTMGMIGLTRTYPVSDQNTATVTLGSVRPTADFTS